MVEVSVDVLSPTTLEVSAPGYKTKVVTISQGGTLNVVNLDTIEHTVTSVAVAGPRAPVRMLQQPRLGTGCELQIEPGPGPGGDRPVPARPRPAPPGTWRHWLQ